MPSVKLPPRRKDKSIRSSLRWAMALKEVLGRENLKKLKRINPLLRAALYATPYEALDLRQRLVRRWDSTTGPFVQRRLKFARFLRAQELESLKRLGEKVVGGHAHRGASRGGRRIDERLYVTIRSIVAKEPSITLDPLWERLGRRPGRTTVSHYLRQARAELRR